MKKLNFSKLMVILMTVFSFGILLSAANKIAFAANDTQYEEADRVSIGDLTNSKSIGLTENQRYFFDKKASHGSLIFSFDLQNNEWSTGNIQMYFVVDDGSDSPWWNDMNVFIFREDGTYMKRQNDAGEFTYKKVDAISSENHSIEVGRLAIIENDKYTGKYYVYQKVDGVIINEAISTYDYTTLTNCIFITGSAKNKNKLVDPNFIEPSYEEADHISVSDLYYNGKPVGNKATLNKNTTYTYNKTSKYGSTVFNFTFKNSTWSVDGDGSQIHFYDTWQTDGMFWLRPDANRIAVTIDSKTNYTVGKAIKAGSHDVEVGRLAIMKGEEFTGKHYLYIKIDGEMIAETTVSGLTEKILSSNSIFVTGTSGNQLVDANWQGDTIKYISNKQVISEFTTTADYLTKPEDPVVEGKKFVGWFDSLGTEWNFEKDKVTGNMTLTAGFITDGETIDIDTYFADETFTPVLRFFVASDTHIGQSVSIRNSRLRDAFTIAYKYSENSKTYTNLDAALFAGDISDDGSYIGLSNFKKIVENSIKEGTLAIIGMGNHDFRSLGVDSDSEKQFYDLFGYCDLHVVINGYHFISLSPDINVGENFSEKKVTWLDEQLSIAQADTPDKPIFLMQHEGIKGTVYGSESWGVTELTDVICKYPNVVDFSGHSHYPIADPRTIWQGTFTALGTGTLNFYEMGINGYKNGGVFPASKTGAWTNTYNDAASAGEFQIVEVDANNKIRVILYDIDSNREIGRYYITNATEDIKIDYSHIERAKSGEKPEFVPTTEFSATPVENSIRLVFDQAVCKDTVESYRIELYIGSKLVQTEYAIAGYYFYPVPKQIDYTISYLKSDTEYTIKIYAVNVWNQVSDEPLTTTVKTGKRVFYEDVIDEITLSDLYSNSSKKQLTTDTLNCYMPCYFIPSENNVYGSFRLRMQILYIAENFQVCFNDSGHANADMVWINNGRNIWFIKDGYSSKDPFPQGLHEVEYGRYMITEGDKAGYTAFYVAIDGERVYTCISEREFTSNGHISLNFGSCYGAGSRYYDIDYVVPRNETPSFNGASGISLSTPFTNWETLGGEITFASPSQSITMWLEDASGAVSKKLTIDGKYTLGTNGDYYSYQVKTNMFERLDGASGNEQIIRFQTDASDFKYGNLNIRKYNPEVFDTYDVVNILDLNISGNTGLFQDVSTEKAYSYAGTSKTYSSVLKYYIATEELNSKSELRTQLGTIWTYFSTVWFQPGDFNVVFYAFHYSNKPSDKYEFSIESNRIYEVECGTIRVIDGEWEGYNYTYLKIDGNLIIGYYVSPDECTSTDYQAAFKCTNGYAIADISLGRTIEYIVDGKTYETTKAINGMKTVAPKDPTKPGLYFIGWYTSPNGGKRVNFDNEISSSDETIQYYARFSDTMYTVDFLSEGELYQSQNVGKGGQAIEPETPKKSGQYKYNFIKWVIKGGNEEFDFSKDITSNLTLEAVFEEYKYRIVYMVDGIEYETRFYRESNPEEIIGEEPKVPELLGANGYWVYSDNRTNKDIYVTIKYNGTSMTASNDISLTAFNGGEVDIADDLTRYYLSFADSEDQAKWLESYPVAGGHERQNITFSWNDNSGNKAYLVYFADNQDFKDAFIVRTESKSIDYVGIFTPGNTYYWKVVGLTNGTCSKVDTFKVLNTVVRWISAGTVFNMRDLGGWTTTDGKTIKYGQIYRGGQLSIDQTGELSYMNDYSFKVFSYLGMKTEIELRGDSSHTNNQFNDLEELVWVNGTGYTDFFKMGESSKAYYRLLFSALADESNYPIYFHCSWGADRTGSLAFLINGVLGVPYEQLVEDYELTSLSYSGKRTRYVSQNSGFINMYNRFMSDYSRGGSLQDAIYNYLTEYIGVDPSEITSLRNILLTDGTETLKTHKVTYMIDGEIYQQSMVFDGACIKEVAPEYFDKHLKYWTLNGEKFDVTTKVTGDLTLEAVFEKTTYEDYDRITLKDIGLGESFKPCAGPVYTYEGSSASGSRIFVFDYEIKTSDGQLDDGVHVEIGDNTWNYKAHVWIATSDTQHIFTNGPTPTMTASYKFEYGKTYRIEIGVVTALDGKNAGKKMLIFLVDGEIISMVPTTADIASNTGIGMSGTEGILHTIENDMTVTFLKTDGTVLETKTIERGGLISAIKSPTVEGKVFMGWFDELGNAWNFETDKVLKDVSLYARFGDRTIDAVILDNDDIEIEHGYKVKVGIKVSEITLPLVNGEILEFEGWYNGNAKLSENDIISEDMNLICRFNVIKKTPSDPVDPIVPEKKPTSSFGCKSLLSSSLSIMGMLTLLGFCIGRKKRNWRV